MDEDGLGQMWLQPRHPPAAPQLRLEGEMRTLLLLYPLIINHKEYYGY